MMRHGCFILMAALTAGLPAVAQPATRPATLPTTRQIRAADVNTLEVQAAAAFNRGDYAIALSFLEKVAEHIKDQPDRLALVQEQIRACQTNMEIVADPNRRDDQAAASERKPDEPRKPHAKPKDGEIVEADVKDLGNFDYDPKTGGQVPQDVTALNGSRIRTRGYMIPLDQADKITSFALVPSLFNCCLGQPAGVQHTIVVRAPKGKTVSYYPDELLVEGTLTVDEKREDGYTISLFEIDTTSVKPAPR